MKKEETQCRWMTSHNGRIPLTSPFIARSQGLDTRPNICSFTAAVRHSFIRPAAISLKPFICLSCHAQHSDSVQTYKRATDKGCLGKIVAASRIHC